MGARYQYGSYDEVPSNLRENWTREELVAMDLCPPAGRERPKKEDLPAEKICVVCSAVFTRDYQNDHQWKKQRTCCRSCAVTLRNWLLYHRFDRTEDFLKSSRYKLALLRHAGKDIIGNGHAKNQKRKKPPAGKASPKAKGPKQAAQRQPAKQEHDPAPATEENAEGPEACAERNARRKDPGS